MGGNGIGCEIMGPTMMDNSTAFSTLGSFIFMCFLVVALSGNANWNEVQSASLKARLSYASHMNVMICCLSMSFHFMHVLGGLLRADHGMLNKMSFLEYMMTCPWMMLVFILLGGPKVQGAKYHTVVMSVTTLVLLFGFIASLLNDMLLKLTCFTFASGLFCGIIYIINNAVREHSEGKEGLFTIGHGSWYKALAKKIFWTWVLFPIWWTMSPEGFSLVTDSHDVDSMVKLFLNCFAKGLYVLYIRSLQSKFKDEPETLSLPAVPSSGKYLDEQRDWCSNFLDIESGCAPAKLPTKNKVLPVASVRSSNKETASTKEVSFTKVSSTRSASKETTSTRCPSVISEDVSGREIEKRQASLEASSPPSEKELESEEQSPPSDKGSETGSTSAEVTQAAKVELLWREIQNIKGQMETGRPFE